jgi:hypothetical protein
MAWWCRGYAVLRACVQAARMLNLSLVDGYAAARDAESLRKGRPPVTKGGLLARLRTMRFETLVRSPNRKP